LHSGIGELVGKTVNSLTKVVGVVGAKVQTRQGIGFALFKIGFIQFIIQHGYSNLQIIFHSMLNTLLQGPLLLRK
jgi:hypothetical protein